MRGGGPTSGVAGARGLLREPFASQDSVDRDIPPIPAREARLSKNPLPSESALLQGLLLSQILYLCEGADPMSRGRVEEMVDEELLCGRAHPSTSVLGRKKDPDHPHVGPPGSSVGPFPHDPTECRLLGHHEEMWVLVEEAILRPSLVERSR